MDSKKRVPAFNASAEGAFTQSGSWRITPRIWFSDDLSTDRRSALRDEARDQLLGRVIDEALRGKCLGAERIHVLDGEGEKIIVVGPPEETPEDPR